MYLNIKLGANTIYFEVTPYLDIKQERRLFLVKFSKADYLLLEKSINGTWFQIYADDFGYALPDHNRLCEAIEQCDKTKLFKELRPMERLKQDYHYWLKPFSIMENNFMIL